MRIDELRTTLDTYGDAVELKDLEVFLKHLDVTRDDLLPWLHFNDEQYQRNMVYRGSACEIFCVCWQPGQRTPIHDHRGSGCGILVLDGILAEYPYCRTDDGHLEPMATCVMGPGEVCISSDSDIHEVVNNEVDGQLVTLHVYTPPLSTIGIYSRDSAEVMYLDANDIAHSEQELPSL